MSPWRHGRGTDRKAHTPPSGHCAISQAFLARGGGHRAIHKTSVQAEGLGDVGASKGNPHATEDEEGVCGLSLWEAPILTSCSSMDQPRAYCYLHPRVPALNSLLQP